MKLDDFKGHLGKPAYEDDDVLLFHGDMGQLLDRLPSSCLPLTVTSPPYNIGKEYEQRAKLADYISWVQSWCAKIFKATKPDGAFWLNLGYVSIEDQAKAIPIPYLIWDKVDFYLIQEIVWNYGAGVAGKKFFSPRNEKWLWYVKDSDSYVFNLDEIRDPNVKYPNQKKNGKLKCNPLGKNPSDVWQIAKVTSGADRSSAERTAHPAQFPLELVRRILLASSNSGDVVLDPFCGSGSLLEAAILAGRKAIGFEIEQKYVSIAIERLQRRRREQAEVARQSVLFPANSSL